MELKLPLGFFSRPVLDREEGAIFFRSMSAATKSARTRAERRLGWVQDMVAELQDHLVFSHPNVPEPDIPEDVGTITNTQVEEAATLLSARLGTGRSSHCECRWVIGIQRHYYYARLPFCRNA